MQALFRSPTVAGSVLRRVLVGFLALYLLGSLLILTVVLDDIVSAVAPGRSFPEVLAEGLLPLGVLYLAVRVFLEPDVRMNLRPYLTLPVARTRLVRFFVGMSLLSRWNLVPLVVWVAIWAIHLRPLLSTAASAAFLASLVLGFGVLTHTVAGLRAVADERPRWVLGAGGLLGAWIGLDALGWIDGRGGEAIAGVSDVSAWLFGGVLDGGLIPLFCGVAVYAAAAVLHVRHLRNSLRLDAGGTRWRPALFSGGSGGAGAGDLLRRLAAQGPTASLVALEIRMILRNTQPRRTLYVLPIVCIGLPVMIGFIGDASITYAKFDVDLFFPGLYATGFLLVSYGQLMFAWEGTRLDGLITHLSNPRRMLWAKLVVLQGMCTGIFLTVLPALLLHWSDLAWVLLAFLVYNVGMASPLILLASLFNTTPISLNASDLMASSTFSGGRAVVVLLFVGLPALPFLWATSLPLYLGSVAAFGAVSLLGLPLWMRALHALWLRRRHSMMASFRANAS